MRRTLTAAALLLAALAAGSADLRAQGCPGIRAPSLASGRTMVRSGFEETITCAAVGVNFMIIGTQRINPPLAITPPTACVEGCSIGCTLDLIVPLMGTTLTVTPPRVPAPAVLCLQCINVDTIGICFTFSEVFDLTVLP